jgi:hypothetical protein
VLAVGEADQGARVAHGEVLALDIVLADHRRRAEPLPDLLRAQVDAVFRVQGGELPVGRVQRALRGLRHRAPFARGRRKVHRHDVDAGQGNVIAEHRADHRQGIVLQPGWFDREGQPHLELGVGLLQAGDRLGPALRRGGVVQRCPFDVQVDGGEVVGADH